MRHMMLGRRQLRSFMLSLRNISSRQLVFVAILVCCLWTYMLLSATRASQRSSEELKREIVDLSELYVKTLAHEHKDLVDGPYSGRLTGYDLKKTMAVLLQDMLERITKLENVVRNASIAGPGLLNTSANQTAAMAAAAASLFKEVGGESGGTGETEQASSQIQASIQKKLGVLDQNPVDFVEKGPKARSRPIDFTSLIRGAQESCHITPEEKARFPECDEKRSWMRKHWKSDKCYSVLGVDGSECSFIIYLSEVEHYCPRLPFRIAQAENLTRDGRIPAQLRLDVDGLLERLHNPTPGRQTYSFMRMRIQRMWPVWIKAAKNLQKKGLFGERGKKKIVVHLGLLTSKANLHIAEESFKGGPLGELVQWSDLISALYVLGHEVVVTSEVEELNNIISRFPSSTSSCQATQTLFLDILYTDIIGLTQFKKKIGKGYPKFSCLLRVVDTFGTQPKYNNMRYMLSHKLKSPWGGKMLITKQFFTMYPHTPDNSFMGFVVEEPANFENLPAKRKIALVYGKHKSMWTGMADYLDIVNEFFEVHGTVADSKAGDGYLPSYVHNHGLLVGKAYQDFLQEATLFIGLGFPYEGPAPMEAIANGVIFLNPKFTPPHGRDTTPFFKTKPTDRRLTSQHPYIEKYIGEPYSYLIDIHNPTQVRELLQKVLQNPVTKGKIPLEFTPSGMLQRMNAYVERQEFCATGRPPWPPVDAVQFFLGLKGESCEQTCERKGLVCEPVHFPTINRRVELQERGVACENIEFKADLLYPAYQSESRRCIFQADPLLFSCAEEADDLMRFCPCRDFIPGQVALCKTCL